MMKIFRKFVYVFLAIVGCLVVLYFALPSYQYLLKAIIYKYPKIDQYTIFHNRIVKAGSPLPWKAANEYNRLSIPDKYLNEFKKNETIAFVVIKDSALWFEQYWEGYSNHSYSNPFSMTKSIVSLALGCAIDDGVIRNVDQPVSDFFPQFKGYKGTPLTIRHLLTMSAGVDLIDSNEAFASAPRLYYGSDLHQVVFSTKEIAEPGKRFIYQSGVTQLLAFLIEKATGENLASYVSRKLWTPMHAEENALWSLDRKGGMEKAYCCFNSNARDLARFGQLILNKGSWDGKQLVSETYLKQAIVPDTTLVEGDSNEINHEYGFQYWIMNYKGMMIPYMSGMAGQYVFAIPDKNMVVVRLGRQEGDRQTWLDAAMDLIAEKPDFIISK